MCRLIILVSLGIVNIFALKENIRNNDILEFFGNLTSLKVDSSKWMKDNIGWLGNRTLKEISMPGTHDSGMSQMNRHTAFASRCNLLTQSVPVLSQLVRGARYLDVRPVISAGDFLTGHYARLPGGSWQGGNGQSMEEIVSGINLFTASHQEVMLISLSHCLNTDVGNRNYRLFNQAEWDRLFQLLDKTNDLFHSSGDVYLPSLTLGELTNNGKRSAVLFILDYTATDVNLGNRLGKGYFYSNNLKLYNKYSNTNKVLSMAADQMRKMKEVPDYFLLSWTLSQDAKDAALCSLKLSKSIYSLAKIANNHLAIFLYPEVSVSARPNIILVDYIQIGVAELAVNINLKLDFEPKRSSLIRFLKK